MTDIFIWLENNPHITTLITTLISVLIGVILTLGGWFYIAKKNRELEIFKQRLPLRIDMLKQTIDYTESFKKLLKSPKPDASFYKEMKSRSEYINKEIQLFGTSKEMQLWEDFMNAYKEYAHDPNKATAAFDSLVDLIIETLRKELNFKLQD